MIVVAVIVLVKIVQVVVVLLLAVFVEVFAVLLAVSFLNFLALPVTVSLAGSYPTQTFYLNPTHISITDGRRC